MIEYVFRPIDKWPRAFTKDRRKQAPFGTFVQREGITYKSKAPLSFDRIVRDLANEVQRHGANRVIIQIDRPLLEIRRDGLPYSDGEA
jgi:hypothetical protein